MGYLVLPKKKESPPRIISACHTINKKKVNLASQLATKMGWLWGSSQVLVGIIKKFDPHKFHYLSYFIKYLLEMAIPHKQKTCIRERTPIFLLNKIDCPI